MFLILFYITKTIATTITRNQLKTKNNFYYNY